MITSIRRLLHSSLDQYTFSYHIEKFMRASDIAFCNTSRLVLDE